MLKQQLQELKDYIKRVNPYFNEGLELAFNKPEAEIFLDDNRGNYFYLRLPNNMTFIQGGEYAMVECSPGLAVRANVILVAYYQAVDSDEDKLLLNMVNTLQTSGKNINFTGAIYRKETTVETELQGQSREVIDAALAAIPQDAKIVSVNFILTAPIILNHCIVNPCTSC